jgi:NADPH:quinone reductase-like Zn-dependent oxidoreductase
MRILGFGLRAPKARIRGMDVAGTVEAVGSNVTQFQPGDDVYGTCNGAFAEHATARADTLAPKPSNLTFEQAERYRTAPGDSGARGLAGGPNSVSEVD